MSIHAGRTVVLALLISLICSAQSGAQTYRNVVNLRFHTVASGPMQAIVVDVPAGADDAAVRRAVAARVNRTRQARQSTLLRELEYLRRMGILKGEAHLGIPDVVMIRRGGRLALPGKTRSHDGNDLQFQFVPENQPGGWTQAQASQLGAIVNVVYGELKNVFGPPSWSGTVRILNGDTTPEIIPDRQALSGGVFNASTNEILFAQFNAAQTKVLNLTQMMALAFRGPASISYDAWERGMARAATLVTVRNVLPLLQPLFPGEQIDVADPLWHALDRYDLLNQPPLGNDRFFPLSKTNEPVNPASLAGMLVPRLQMSGSAWLKVAAENPNFFRQFNDVYYHALAGNPSLKNSVPDLKTLAASVVPNVEGMPFEDWYRRQYVLDTSVSAGDKVYAWAFPLRPDTAGEDDFAIGVVLVYFRTLLNADGTSDEANLNGISFPIYWDFEFATRLFLGAQYERVDIRDGLGTVAPTFFNTVGGDPALEGRMRITMDFPVGSDSVRLHVAPRSMGKAPAPNNFWGAVVGADTGTLRIETETGVDETVDVRQGAFGKAIDSRAFSRPNRATLTFTPQSGTPTVRQVNVGYREYTAILFVSDPVTSVTHTLPGGPAMVSFPIQPLRPKAAEALLNPTTDQPIFNDQNLLMAQWRQTAPGEDKYFRYPNMDPLTPGYGYWANLPGPTPVKIIGRTLGGEREYSTSLLFGWNQIGNPYEQAIDIADLRFQYQADNVPQTLAQAVSRGWIAATQVPALGEVVVFDFDPQLGYIRGTTLQPWKGYWIRVLVTEGLTITYPNPALAAGRAARSRASATRGSAAERARGWSVPVTVRGPGGNGATVYVGQSLDAQDGFDPRADTLRPPEFTRAAPIIAVANEDWGAHSGDYFADVRRTGSRAPWEIVVHVPDPARPYTLSWGDLRSVPRSTRLILVDSATGRRQYLDSSSGYTFTPGSSSTRRFQIIAEDRSRAGLRVLNLAARTTRAGGISRVELGYELTAGAEVVAEIRDASGRVIRRLGAGRAAPAGPNQAVWDTKDDRGVSVPAGAYIVQITARTPEGEMARAAQPVLVLR